MSFFFTRLLHGAVSPNSSVEDIARREFILNVLLLGALTLLTLAIAIDVGDRLFADPVSYAENSFPSLILGILFAFFLALYTLSRARRVALASYLLLAAFFLLGAVTGFTWGIDVPAQLVFYPLVIVMAGVLISTRFAFVVTVFVAATMLITGYLQRSGVLAVNQYWKTELWTWTDILMIIVIYAIVATVSWLANREIEKSLHRARRSERELKEERDTLEERVKERTEELKKAELERMDQTYHFVEFGRIASGIFHDLINPLAALSLNIDRIADAPGTRKALSEDIARAKRAAGHMQALMDSMRKHLAREGNSEFFSVSHVLEDTVQVLSSYAGSHGVRLIRKPSTENIFTYGSPVALTQVLTNLISNAVQSYPEAPYDDARTIDVGFTHTDNILALTVTDYGSGIPEEALARIFEPFFTTKGDGRGIGIGLSLARRIIEKDFGGTLTVESAVAQGSTFTVRFPIREP